MPRTRHVKRYVGLLVVASALFGAVWGFISLATDSPAKDFDVRMPSSVPPMVKAMAPEQPFIQASNTHLPYADQRWCFTDKPKPLAGCVILYQLPYELRINEEGKEPVNVDGVQGWLWRLGPTDFAIPSNARTTLSTEEFLRKPTLADMRPALTEEFESEYDINKRAQPYRYLYGSWREEGEEIAGEAIVIQWNSQGKHYLLAGPLWLGITEADLLAMANSLKSVDAMDIRNFPGAQR